MPDDDMREETVAAILEQWIHYRDREEWLMRIIVESRGIKKSTFKRMLKETQKMIKKIERQLFNV